MNEYFVPISDIQGGNNIFWVANGASLLIWVGLVYRYYYLPEHHKNNPITNILLFFPVIGIIYNVYLDIWSKGVSPPRTWNMCLDIDIKEEDKEKGVVGYFDYTCLNNHTKSEAETNKTFSTRMYYLNYLVFFIILVIQSAYTKQIFSKTQSGLINLLCMDCILVIIGSIVPLFSGNPIWGYIILSFLSGIIWMSSTLLLIMMVNMYKYMITGSSVGHIWARKRRTR